MKPDLIRRVRQAAQRHMFVSYHLRESVATVDDISQQMLLELLQKEQMGVLPERVPNWILRKRAIDAHRKHGCRKRAYGRVCTLHSYNDSIDSHLMSQAETADIRKSPLEMVESLREPTTEAEQLRDAFEDQGCLWTANFHESVQSAVDEIKRQAMIEAGETVGVAASRVRLHGASGVILEWIREHPGHSPTNAQLANQHGLARETATRILRRLVQEKVIRAERCPSNELGKGRYAYWVCDE